MTFAVCNRAAARSNTVGGPTPIPPSHIPHYGSVSHCAEAGAIPEIDMRFNFRTRLPAVTKTDNLRGNDTIPLSLRNKSCSGDTTEGTFVSLRLVLIHPTPPHPFVTPDRRYFFTRSFIQYPAELVYLSTNSDKRIIRCV